MPDKKFMEKKMINPPIELTVPSHPRFLQLVRGVMAKTAQILSISSEEADYITLAVDEACSNIIRHSYMGNPNGKMVFSIRFLEKKLEISIMDYGKPWEPGGIPRAPSEIKPGGRGLYIIHQVMDQVDYFCSDTGENTIRMIRTF